MNLFTALVAAVLAVLTGLAVLHCVKKRGNGCGSCGDCPYEGTCEKRKK